MVRNIFAISLLALLSQGVSAQDASEQYAQKISPTVLKNYLRVLAHDSLEGRETGMLGQQKAARYISSTLASLGFEPYNGSFYQNYPLSKNTWENRNLSLAGERAVFANDFYCFYNIPDVKVNDQNAAFAFVGYGIENEQIKHLGNANLKGKIVIVRSGDPMNKKGISLVTGTSTVSTDGANFRAKITALQKYNPSLIVYVDDNFAINSKRYRHNYEHPGVTLTTNKPSTNAAVLFVSTDWAQKFLKASGKSLDKLSSKYSKKKVVEPKLFTAAANIFIDKKSTPIQAQNVLGFLPGKDKPEEVLVLSAHYDHLGVIDGKVYNGADDDGSGTASVMAMANAFMQAAKNGERPSRSILFLLVSGEEKGLLGSSYYADNPVFPLKNTIADLNTDMVGRIDTAHAKNSNYIYIIGSDKLSTELHAINEAANKTYTKLNLDYTYNKPTDPNRFYYRSDHYNFAKNNVPIIFYFNGVHDDYHQETDEIEKINFDIMAKRVQLVFHTAWQLANQPNRIKVDVVNDFKSDR